MSTRFKKPTLKANLNDGMGHVGVNPEWDSYDAVLRVDLLQDWIADLEELREKARDDIWSKNK